MQGATDPLHSSGQPEVLVPGMSHWLSHLNSPCLTFPIWEMGPRLLLQSLHLECSVATKARGICPESLPSTSAHEEAEARRRGRPKELPELAPCPMPGPSVRPPPVLSPLHTPSSHSAPRASENLSHSWNQGQGTFLLSAKALGPSLICLWEGEGPQPAVLQEALQGSLVCLSVCSVCPGDPRSQRKCPMWAPPERGGGACRSMSKGGCVWPGAAPPLPLSSPQTP